MRMREIAQTRVRYGYRMIRVLLNREGWKVGKDLVYRLYREEGLGLRKRPPGRRRAVVHRQDRFRPTGPNQVWVGLVKIQFGRNSALLPADWWLGITDLSLH